MTLAPIKNLGKSLPTQVHVKEMHVFVGLFKHKILSKKHEKKKKKGLLSSVSGIATL